MRALLFLLIASCGNAMAAVVQYDFSYDLSSGEQISGSLLGELQVDGDTIDIVDLLAIEYTGIGTFSGESLAFGGLDIWESNTVSLSGDIIEFRTEVPFAASPNGLIWFSSGGGVAVFEFVFDPISPDLQTAWSVDGETIDASAWTIAAVPVPAAVWLFASGMLGLGWLRRR